MKMKKVLTATLLLLSLCYAKSEAVEYILEDKDYGLISMRFLPFPEGIIAFLIQDKATSECKGYFVTYLDNYKDCSFLKEVVKKEPMSQEDLEAIFPEFIELLSHPSG